MDQKQWIITGILIIVVAALAFSFNETTGQATKTIESSLLPIESEISVSPQSLIAGEEVAVTLKPGRGPQDCLDATISFYRLKDDRTLGLRAATKDISNSLGTRRNCDTIVITTHKTQTNWKGSYVAVVQDKETGENVVSNLFVVN